MTYEQFKIQLYHSLLELDTAKETEIGILEKGTTYQDDVALRVIRAVNLSDRGKEEVVLQADLLYAVWDKGQYDCMLYWPVRQLFDRYKSEGWQSVLPELAAAIGRENVRKGKLPTEHDTFVQHRANLILRPLSLERRQDELINCIYWTFGDIALVLYLLVYDDPENYLSLKLERAITDQWGKRDAVLLTGALLNCQKRMPPRLYYAQDALRYYDERGGVFMSGEDGVPIKIDNWDEWQGRIGYRLTTTRRINGAIALFYPGVKERLAELLDGDYFVAFTSVHEVDIYPVRHKHLSDVKAELANNNALIEGRSFLTGRTYRYVQLRGELMET